jgi:polysaccharide export outer membrane protein
MQLLKKYFLIIIVFFSACSCVSHKSLVYFFDPADTVKYRKTIISELVDSKIQPDDILSISVNSINPEATMIFNDQNAVVKINDVATTQAASLSGYLVDSEGNIDFPMLGKQKVMGLSTQQFKDTLKLKLDKYLKDPIVNVRLQNFKITVLGEVNRPATFTIPSERITLLEALGRAGDMTIYGQKHKVLIIRESNGIRETARVDLQSKEFFNSPYYYLNKNDIVVVDPSNAKTGASQDAYSRYVGLVLPLFYVVSLLITLFK